MEFLSSQTAVRTAALSTTEISVAAGCRPFFFVFVFFPLSHNKKQEQTGIRILLPAPHPIPSSWCSYQTVAQVEQSSSSRAT